MQLTDTTIERWRRHPDLNQRTSTPGADLQGRRNQNATTPLICPICGKTFKPRKNHGKLQIYCSVQCCDRSKIKNYCTDCGSTVLDKRCISLGGIYKTNKCTGCFERWIKARGRKVLVCIVCGKKSKPIRPRKSLADLEKTYTCPSCSKGMAEHSLIYFNKCEYCGGTFTARSSKTKYCRECHEKGLVPNSSRIVAVYCADCGCDLSINKKHSSSSAVCSQCMWLRRKRYKMRAIVGDGVSEKEINSLVLLSIISLYGEQKTGERRYKLCQYEQAIKRAEKLIKGLQSGV